MKYGFKICFHKSISYNKELKEFLDGKVEHFTSEESYKCRRKSGAFYRRGIFGFSLSDKFKSPSSQEEIKYTFKRLSRNRRVFGVVPIDQLKSENKLDLNQCMCAEHRGGQRVNLIVPYNDNNYITYFETGTIKG